MTYYDAFRAGGNEELIKRLFNKVYSAVIFEKIFSPPETAVLLAAYACQAKFGSAKSLGVPKPPVNDLLPRSTLDNHDLTLADWENRISSWHLKLANVSFLDSIVEYLDIAQDVELYGASIFQVETKSKQRLWISLDAVGLNFYESKRKPPTNRYIWNDILSLKSNGERLEIIFAHEPDKTLVLFVGQKSTCDLFMDLYHGSRQLYAHRKKIDPSSKYITRSESNSSVRMRPHKLSKAELANLRQIITEMEFELPRRSMNFEFAPWQVKSQLRQIRGIETKLALDTPSTAETRQLQRLAAEIRVFLEQDAFKAQEEDEARLHHYRGNFAIRIGGTSAGNDGYSSDVDSGADVTTGTSAWQAPKQNKENVHGAQTNSTYGLDTNIVVQPFKDPAVKTGSQTSDGQRNSLRNTAHSKSKLGTETDFVQPSKDNSAKSSGQTYDILENASKGQLHAFPQYGMNSVSSQPSKDDSVWKHVHTFDNYETASNHSADVGANQSFTLDDQTLNMVTPISELPFSTDLDRDYGKRTLSPKSSLKMPSLPSSQWNQSLKSTERRGQSAYASGFKHGQTVNDDVLPPPFRPVLQPKPKVAPRTVGLPITVTPDRDDLGDLSDRRKDLKFSSMQRIQKGFAKSRVDLFEAM